VAAPPAAPTTPAASAAAPAGPAPQRAPSAEEWAQTNAAKLDDANLKKGLRLFWFATGKDDGLITTTKATVELFEKRGFKPIFKETPGAHTWLVWRAYLTEFAPLLFQSGQAGRSTEQAR
jgi:enterochelin esterase family protein